MSVIASSVNFLKKYCAVLSHFSDSLRPSGFSVHGILQQRILEWVALHEVLFSRGSFTPRDRTFISLMFPALAGRFFATVKCSTSNQF